ncbi:hypothetical protein KGQ24_03375 [Patescibacteria group bacterium]|nr:hypothetical protein [Patescibacteria group bacterium]
MRFKIGVLGALALGLILGGAADTVNAAQAMAQAPALPEAHAIAVKAFASDVQPANLSATKKSTTKKSTTKKKTTKKPAAKKPAAAKSTTKKTTTKKPAAKKSTSKTSKAKQAAGLNVNADKIEQADLGGAKADAADLQADGSDAQGDDAQLQVQDQPNAQTPTDTVNLPIAEQLQPASSAPRALTVAGLSGVTGLGLVLLLKRIFFH